MGDNQNMEKKIEEVKVMHSQHARILKEDDEIWISSEDLNTENSSEDDRSKTKHATKKKLKVKQRKRSTPNIRFERPSITSLASTSKVLDARFLMPANEDIHSRSTDESRTSDEECQVPRINPKYLSKRLSLEDWRPMRGALNPSSLEETTSTAVNETGNFFNAMLYKLKSLKSFSEEKPASEETFKYLKNTPEVRQKLDFISKLDEEINETINRYKAEREERLKTEFEMCKTLHEERNADVFLKMCNFDEKLVKFRGEAKQNESTEERESNFNATSVDEETFPTNFIRKNIYAAKEGLMAGFSLTDEEKTKIAQILKDIDDFQLDDAKLTLSTTSLAESSLVKENTQANLDNERNAFSIPERDKVRISEIDSELEKFNEDKDPSRDQTVPVIKDEEFWKQYILEKNLKEIDVKLEQLYASYKEDEEKLKRNMSTEEIEASS